MMAQDSSPSVASLMSRFEEHLRRAVLCTARGIDMQLDHQHLNEPELVVNLLTHGPIERGLNVTNGGVDLYNMCVDGAGLANVADSLAALELRVEQQQRITWNELAEHLRNNYQGVDGERVRLMMNTAPHYGEGISAGDRWALQVSRLLTRLVTENPTPGGRRMIPGWFSWADTLRLGKQVGPCLTVGEAASRLPMRQPRAGFCGWSGYGDGSSDCRCSARLWQHSPIQLELDPCIAQSDDAVDTITNLITTHFALGGTLFNINIVDAEQVLAAHKNPSQYPDLVVRVTGFTAYFANLRPISASWSWIAWCVVVETGRFRLIQNFRRFDCVKARGIDLGDTWSSREHKWD